MKSFKITIIWLLYISVGFGQTIPCNTCAVKGIATNPVSPINNEKLSKTNTFFDWTNLGQFSVNSQYWNPPYNYIESPFHQVINANLPLAHFLDNPDRLPQSGWELIKYNLGYKDDHTPNGLPNRDIYIVLYNKYMGILRVFVAANEVTPFNGITMTISFSAGSQTNLLSNASESFALDQFQAFPSISSIAKQIPSAWAYADYHMGYDPCTCFRESLLGINIQYLNTTTLKLSGSIVGDITSKEDIVTRDPNGKVTDVKEDGYSFFNKAAKVGSAAKKSFDNMQKFVDDQFTTIDNEGKTNQQIANQASNIKNSLNLFQGALKSSSFLKDGLKSIPYVGAALSLVDMFTGGGNTGPLEVKIMPLSLQANVKLTGEIVGANDFPGILVTNPGSLNSACKTNDPNNDLYPYYNEVLGVFNLLETPKVYSTLSSYSTYVNGSDDYRDDATRTFQVAPIKYVLNPAAGFNASKVEIIASLELDGLPTKFVPLSCIGTFSYSYYAGYVSQLNGVTNNQFHDIPESRVKLKLLINLERNDTNSNTQNVLLVMKYPIQYLNNLPANSSFNQDYNTYQENITLQNTDVSGTIGARENITIGQGVTFQSGSNLIAGERVTLQAGASLPANVTLRIALPNGCAASYVAPAIADYTYCNSATYNNASRALRKASEDAHENPKNKIESDRLTTAFPNPTNGHVTFRYYLEEPTQVKLNLIDLTGKVVATPVDAYQELGPYEVSFDATNLPAGVYIYSLETNKGKETKRLIVIK